MPRVVVRPDLEREVDASDDAALAKFLAAIEGHRWEGPFRLAVMYFLHRSELLGLGWLAVDLKKGTVRIARTRRRARPPRVERRQEHPISTDEPIDPHHGQGAHRSPTIPSGRAASQLAARGTTPGRDQAWQSGLPNAGPTPQEANR